MKPLALNSDGTLKLLESDVAKEIIMYCAAHGFEAIRTPATTVQYPSGHWGKIFNEGYADYIFVKPIAPGTCRFFFAELKCPKATTSAARKAKQAAFEYDKTLQGYLCYRATGGVEDQLEEFKRWFRMYY